MNETRLLNRQVKLVDKMNLAELKEKFTELYGFEPGQTNTVNLRKRIIYRFQELYFGELSADDKAFLERIAADDLLANLKRPGDPKVSKLKGTRYTRIWHGRKYEVTVLGDGTFSYDGKVFNSLSAVAREITGTRWNGKVFFGVK